LTVDHLIWRRYRRNTRGIVELAMDVNPEVAKAHKYGPFLPVGLVIKIPIVRSQLQGGPVRAAAITLYGTE
jgi:phage tail protein X